MEKDNPVAKIKDNEIHKYTTLLFIPLTSKRNETLNNVHLNRFDNKLIRLVSSRNLLSRMEVVTQVILHLIILLLLKLRYGICTKPINVKF